MLVISRTFCTSTGKSLFLSPPATPAALCGGCWRADGFEVRPPDLTFWWHSNCAILCSPLRAFVVFALMCGITIIRCYSKQLQNNIDSIVYGAPLMLLFWQESFYEEKWDLAKVILKILWKTILKSFSKNFWFGFRGDRSIYIQDDMIVLFCWSPASNKITDFYHLK